MPAEDIENLDADEFNDVLDRIVTGTASNKEMEDAKDSAKKLH